MFVIYAASLVLWLMLMDVGAEKSWAVFNLSDGRRLAQMIGRCAVSALITYLLLVLPGKHQNVFNPSVAIITSFFFYGIYIMFNLKHRESWKEFLKLDKWNLIVFVGCLITAFCAATIG